MPRVVNGKDHLSEFRVMTSRSGLPTAIHLPSQCLIHSKIDPRQEAKEIMAAQNIEEYSEFVLFGGGLGYIAEALLDSIPANNKINVIEPDLGLLELSRVARPSSDYHRNSRIRIIPTATMALLHSAMADMPDSSMLILSPYLNRLKSFGSPLLQGYLDMIRSELASASTYNPLLDANSAYNKKLLSRLPSVLTTRLAGRHPVMVCGAGPSLLDCMEFIHAHRTQLILIAVSGAIPVLSKSGIYPDWVIMMEAQDIILQDIETLPAQTKRVLFPSVNPNAFGIDNMALSGAYDGSGLESRGGSSLVPALDFAMKCSTAAVIIAGADLGVQNGQYANGANRKGRETPANGLSHPKYASMRAGLERILLNRKDESRLIVHVLNNGKALKGSCCIPSHRLKEMLFSETTQVPV